MAPIGWYARVEALLNKAIGNNKLISSKSYRKKNVLVTSDGVLYVWLDVEHAILSIDLNRLCSVAAAEEEIDGSSDGCGEAMQVLIPSSPPCYDVTSMVPEEMAGQRLALVGSQGVNVVQIPHHRPANNNRSLCSSVEIGERFFVCNPQCEVLGVKWHPGSQTHSHLLVLLSNNNLRVYDCGGSVGSPVQVYQLGPPPVFRLHPSPSSSFGRVLGETAVDFDFGRPCWREGKSQKLWPVYVLRGNGDVYAMWLAEPHLNGWRCELKGPLSMHPPAEDNYGVDACSLLCLPSQPPLLVIATSYGMIYHCVALEDDQPTDPEAHEDESALSLPSPTVSLYVYESLELDISSSNGRVGNEEDLEAETEVDKPTDGATSTPIRIFKDGSTIARYHCCHSTDVHTVALPLVAQLQTLAHAHTAEECADVLSTLEEQTCVVEHVVCTKPLSNSISTPVIGLGVISGVSLGGTTLLCLLANYELLTIPLAPTYLDSVPRLMLSEQTTTSTTDQWSTAQEMSQVTKEPFDQYIRRLLQRRNSNPIYKSEATSSEPLLKDCLNLLNKSTRILREEYIQKLDLAHETIQERVKVLQDLQAQQMAEIKQLNSNKVQLTNKAEYLAERYEELKERQESIVRRVENILGGLLKNAPVLSDAEVNMRRELLTIEERFKYLKNAMQQVRAKQSHQRSSIDRTNRQRPKGITSEATGIELQQIKNFLVEETNSITSLANQLKQVQLILNL